MTDDPLERYASLLRSTHAPAQAQHDALQKMAALKTSTRTAAERASREEDARRTAPRHAAGRTANPATGSAPETGAPSPSRHAAAAPPGAPAFAIKRHRLRGLALAACLAVLAVAVGLSFALPHLAGPTGAPLGFTVQAFGALTNQPLAPADDRILFESDVLAKIPSDDRYEEEGVYTGCLFRIEGEGIARIRAHIDRGELYRYDYDEFALGADPDRWGEALAWNTSLIGQGERFGIYDLVRTTSLDGKAADDPEKRVGVKGYQRLGATIHVTAADSGSSKVGYLFGFWTNEPVQATGYQDYVDTLDGATLTVTVEKRDGSASAQVISLAAGWRDGDGTSARVLAGTVEEQGAAAFPYGEATYAADQRPVTQPAPAEPIGGANAGAGESAAQPVPDTWAINKNTQALGTPLEVIFPELADPTQNPYPAGSSSGFMTCGNVRVSKTLPSEVDPRAALLQPDVLEEANRSFLASGLDLQIAPDGTLSEGFSYAAIDVTVENTSDGPLQADVTEGQFGTIEQANGEEYFASQPMMKPLWVGGTAYDPRDFATRFSEVPPGETRTFTYLGIVSDEAAASPTFAFIYRNDSHGGRAIATFLIGPTPAQ